MFTTGVAQVDQRGYYGPQQSHRRREAGVEVLRGRVRVDQRGRVTLDKAIRKLLEIEADDELEILAVSEAGAPFRITLSKPEAPA